jgi:hypothetical protein
VALYPTYASASELKTQLRVTDAVDDTQLGLIVIAASRAIDAWCNRQFGSHWSAVARVFDWDGQTIRGGAALEVFDLQTTSGLLVAIDEDGDGVFETDLTVDTDYRPWPWNAAADGKPWTHLVLTFDTTGYWPGLRRGVQVTANWGWTGVPELVRQACLIQAARWFMRRDSAYGIAGSPDMGNEMRLLEKLDPDVAMMLKPLRRIWGAAR